MPLNLGSLRSLTNGTERTRSEAASTANLEVPVSGIVPLTLKAPKLLSPLPVVICPLSDVTPSLFVVKVQPSSVRAPGTHFLMPPSRSTEHQKPVTGSESGTGLAVQRATLPGSCKRVPQAGLKGGGGASGVSGFGGGAAGG